MGQKSSTNSHGGTTKDAIVDRSRYPGLRLGPNFVIQSVKRASVWDEFFASGFFNYTSGKLVGESLYNVIGDENAEVLSLLKRQLCLREFTIQLRHSHSCSGSLDDGAGPTSVTEYVVFAEEVENKGGSIGCCSVPDTWFWFLPVHLLMHEKHLTRGKYLSKAPQQNYCIRCGCYTVEENRYKTQYEAVKALASGKRFHLLHNVVHNACFSCSVKYGCSASETGSSVGYLDDSAEETSEFMVLSPRALSHRNMMKLNLLGGDSSDTDETNGAFASPQDPLSPQAGSLSPPTLRLSSPNNPKGSGRSGRKEHTAVRIVEDAKAENEEASDLNGSVRPEESVSRSASKTTRLVAVLIEGDQAAGDYLKRTLSQCGIASTTFADGQAALKFLAKNQVGLVVCDVVLPGLSGSEVMRSILSSRANKTPILAVAGSPMFSELAIGCGASAFMLKSASVAEQKRVIYSLMTKANTANPATDHLSPTPPPRAGTRLS